MLIILSKVDFREVIKEVALKFFGSRFSKECGLKKVQIKSDRIIILSDLFPRHFCPALLVGFQVVF